MSYNKIRYYIDWIRRTRQSGAFCKGHAVRLYNWSRPFAQDMWLIDFIEKRGLLDGRRDLKVALYSVFGPRWMLNFDCADLRLFVERENLHKPHFRGYLHRHLDDDRFSLSLGFDEIVHPQYMRFPFWLMWTVFPPTVRYADVKEFVHRVNHLDPDPAVLGFCAYVCSHDDSNRRQIYEEFSTVAPLSCPGKLFHNDDRLKTVFCDDKIAYLGRFKFNLTPENTDCKGYVTEKLFEAIAAGTVPIYNGSENDPEPGLVNKDAVIFIQLGERNADAVDLVTRLHCDDKSYRKFASQPRLLPGAEEIIWSYYDDLERRLKEIIRNL